jgi:hypothetical protein
MEIMLGNELKKNSALKPSVTRNPPCSFLNISRSASVFILIPLSTYNSKDFLKDLEKLPSMLMFQKEFSKQMIVLVRVKIMIQCE